MHPDHEILDRYIHQPVRLPAELRARIEREWGDRPVQLYAMADLMRPPVTVQPHESLRRALERMHHEHVRELPVVDETGRVIGFVDEGALAHLYLASSPSPPSSRSLDRPGS